MRNDVKITDIAPQVLKHEGVKAEEAWNLDGRAFADIERMPSMRSGIAFSPAWMKLHREQL